ncbi:normal mucosa of esophagus-specific gene 1 protein-like [Glandiceps talaboti]
MSRLLTLAFLKKHYELIPVVFFTGAVCCMSGSYVYYMLSRKPDVTFNRWSNKLSAPWDVVDPSKPQKLMTVNQKYQPDVEVLKLRREIEKAYSPR